MATLLGCAESENERISAVYDLKADPTPRNVERIRQLADDPDRDVRATALNALVSLRVEGVDELVQERLDDEDGFVRATAAKLLGDLGNPADAPLLAARLREDSDPIVRRRAAEALTVLGGDVALAALADGLRDPFEDVRLASARGLRELDPGYATADFARLLLEDPNKDVRVQAAGALGETGDPEVRPVLEAALSDENEFVRAAAANALRVHRDVQPKKLATAPKTSPESEAPAPGETPEQ